MASRPIITTNYTITDGVISPSVDIKGDLPNGTISVNMCGNPSMAKGGTSLTDLSSTAYSAFQSPAAMVFSPDVMDVSVGYMLWQPAHVKTNIVNAAGMYKINEKFGLAAGVSYGMSPKYDIVDGSGKASGVFRPSEMEFAAGLAWRLHKNISIGANVGYASNRLSESASYSALVADVHAMAVFGGFKASVAVSDIGTGVTSASGAKFSLPASLGLAAGYDVALQDRLVNSPFWAAANPSASASTSSQVVS